MKIIIRILAITFFITIIFACKGVKDKDVAKTEVANTESVFSEIKKQTFPKPIGIINDYGHVFTELQQTELSKILYDYEVKTTRQIVIVTVDSINPYNDIQKYATHLGQKWGVGALDKNNGLVILLCNPIREIGIATGTGTQKVLTDTVCKMVIDSTIIPEFNTKNYYGGIKNGVVALIKKWN